MARKWTMAAIAVTILCLAIQPGYAFRILRQSESVSLGSQNKDYYGASEEESIHPGTTTELPEEIKQDIAKIVEIVEKEEKQIGRVVTKEEMQEIEKQLQEAPWYQKFSHWLRGAYRSTKNAVEGIFSSQQGTREARGYQDFYDFYSN
ncbi:unnamed protein product [Allacma fusca]|uniref:Uncharacterized protein n=1 Tax=Allacma fusca TaxID=39272 RepID=A0A8J2J3I7_9HEXA|nr:unnamed protein product [Allacma fusca]